MSHPFQYGPPGRAGATFGPPGYNSDAPPPGNMYGRPMPHMGPHMGGHPPMHPGAHPGMHNFPPEIETRRLGFDEPKEDRPPADLEGLMIPEPSAQDYMRTLAITNITKSFTDVDVQNIAAVGGGLILWMRDIKPNCVEWQPRGIAFYQDIDTLCIAQAIIGEARVVRKKDPADKAKSKTDMSAQKAPTNGENGETKTGDDATLDGDEEEYDQLIMKPDLDEQPAYIEEWRSKGSALSVEELQPKIEAARASLKQLCATISERNRRSGVEVQAKNGVETEQVTDEATGQIITITKTGEDDDLTNVPEEYRPRVLEEIAAFRERSKIREAEKAQKEQDEKDAQAQLSSYRPSRLADETDGNALPKGPKNAPHGPKKPKKAWTGGEKLFDMSLYDRKPGEEELLLREVYNRRFAERMAVADAGFPEMLRKWKVREERTAEARKREAEREAREQQEEQEFRDTLPEQMNWLMTHDEDEEKRNPTHEYYKDPDAYKRKMRSVWEAERIFDEQDAEAAAREAHDAEERRKRNERAADTFLDQHAEELQAAAPAAAPFKMSLGAAAAKQAVQKRNLAMAESLLEDDDELEAAAPKRVLKPLNPNAHVAPGKLTDEEKLEVQNELAAEIPRDQAALFAWPVRWEFFSERMLEEQLRPWLETKLFDLFAVKDEELLGATEGNLRARLSPQAFVDRLKELLDEEEAQEFVYKMWRLLVFYTEATRRGVM